MVDFAHVSGLVLAAGAGTRAGGPKALRRDEAGSPWLQLAVTALRAGGCADVTVVLGAGAAEAHSLVPDDVAVVVADDWQQGLSASLRAGLRALESSPASTALITLVDLPGLPAEVVSRVLASAKPGADALARAVFEGRPGHPVLLGRDHWAAVAAEAHGDRGAGPYLRAHAALEVDCADLWAGADLDTPP